MVESVTSYAIQGIQQAQQGMQRSAQSIARTNAASQPEGTKDLTRSLVELNQYKNAGIASMKVLKASDEMLGSLLDVKA